MASTGGRKRRTHVAQTLPNSGPSATNLHVNTDTEALDGQDAPSNADLSLRDAESDEDEEVPNATNSDDEEEEERPNRFYGSSSTYHYHIELERSLAKSLDQGQANDLSIHLYNTHALKARLRDPDGNTNIKPWNSKKKWIKPNEDGSLPWHPKKRWTAWPMRPQDVPRKGEEFSGALLGVREDEGSFRKVEDWRMSGDVEEEVVGLMMKKAKERFRERQWEDSAAQQVASASRVASTLDGSTESSESDSIATSSEDQDAETVQKRPKVINQSDNATKKSTILADEDQAAELLKPTADRILSKLDDLLIGLHKSRKGTVTGYPDPRARRSRSKSASERESGPRKGKKHKASASRKRQDEVEDAGGDDVEDDKPVKDKKPVARQPKTLKDLNLRDWSEVIGMASFTGWSPAVIDRAARRCAALFGEGMNFGTGDGTVKYRPDMPNISAPSPPVEMPIEVTQAARRGAHTVTCPVPGCKRTEPFDRPFRWREHMKRVHKSSKEEVEEVEKGMGGVKNVDEDVQDIQEGATSPDVVVEGPAVTNEIAAGLTTDGLHVDGFLQPITVKMPRVRTRGKQQKGSKRRKLHDGDSDNDETEE